jgi:hypothetical protein
MKDEGKVLKTKSIERAAGTQLYLGFVKMGDL